MTDYSPADAPIALAMIVGGIIIGALWIAYTIIEGRKARRVADKWQAVTVAPRCKTRACNYPATRQVVAVDEGVRVTGRCEGCATQGQAMGWWTILPDYVANVLTINTPITDADADAIRERWERDRMHGTYIVLPEDES